MKRNLVDPVHFFDAQGESMLSKDFLSKRVDELERENEKLKRLLAAQLRRNAPAAPDEQKSSSN